MYRYQDVGDTAVDVSRLVVGADAATLVVQRCFSNRAIAQIGGLLLVDVTRCRPVGKLVDRCIWWGSDVIRGCNQLVRHSRSRYVVYNSCIIFITSVVFLRRSFSS